MKLRCLWVSIALFILAQSGAQGDVVCGTWNMKWFPSGRAEHRAKPETESRTIRHAGRAVADAITAMNPSGKNGVIFFFEEIRDAAACSNLVTAIGMTNLSIAAVSAFRERDNRVGWQQVGIATTLPVIEGSWSRWHTAKKATPPRGYASAILDGGDDGLILCYAVHLKSNYGATKPSIRALNIEKRENAALETAKLAAKKIKTKREDGRHIARVIVAGDFNTDVFAKEFANENTVKILTQHGFTNAFADNTPFDQRITHPGHVSYQGSTLDYILFRGFTNIEAPRIFNGTPISDHNIVVAVLKKNSADTLKVPRRKTTD